MVKIYAMVLYFIHNDNNPATLIGVVVGVF